MVENPSLRKEIVCMSLCARNGYVSPTTKNGPKIGTVFDTQNRTGKSEGRQSAFTLSGPALGLKDGPILGTNPWSNGSVSLGDQCSVLAGVVHSRRVFDTIGYFHQKQTWPSVF